MSFKRDGDDHSWLNLLQKRRVSELLTFDIPEDEALLTRNGRFTCLVCSYRPIFDTVNVLAVHRAGKKHQANYEKFLIARDELNALKNTRRHEEFIRQGKITSKELHDDNKPSTSLLKSLGSAVYDPRVKKRKHERKSRLNINENGEPLPLHIENHYNYRATNVPQCTPGYSLPGSSKTAEHHINHRENKSADATQIQNSGKNVEKVPNTFKKTNKKVNIPDTIEDYKKQQAFEERMLSFNIKPYISKRKLTSLGSNEESYIKPVKIPRSIDSIPNPSMTSNNSSPSLTQSIKYTRNSDTKNYPVQINLQIYSDKNKRTSNCTNTSNDIVQNVQKHNVPSLELKNIHCEITPTNSKYSTPSFTSKVNNPTEKKLPPSLPATSFERKEKAEKYLQAIRSGWKKDHRTGKWVKDEDAEFESDDEPPEYQLMYSHEKYTL